MNRPFKWVHDELIVRPDFAVLPKRLTPGIIRDVQDRLFSSLPPEDVTTRQVVSGEMVRVIYQLIQEVVSDQVSDKFDAGETTL